MQKTVQADALPEDVDAYHTCTRAVLSGENACCDLTTRMVRKNGQVIWIKVMTSLIWQNAAAPLLFFSRLEDITQAHQSAGKLEHATALLEVLAVLADRTLSRRLDHRSDPLPRTGHPGRPHGSAGAAKQTPCCCVPSGVQQQTTSTPPASPGAPGDGCAVGGGQDRNASLWLDD